MVVMSMRKKALAVGFGIWMLLGSSGWTEPLTVEEYQETADRIVARARSQETGWNRLSELCTRFPHRLSGTQPLEDCIDWVLEQMVLDGFDNVRGEAVEVPHWERRAEELTVLGEAPYRLGVIALGGSISTPTGGLEAPVLVVTSFEDLERRKEEAAGKIVVYNVPFTTYGETGRYRWDGPSKAAQVGAVASLVRSVTPNSLATVHTGGMSYDEKYERIPAGAISVEAASMFERQQRSGIPARVKLVLETEVFPDAPSRNVIAEIRGSEKPNEVVVLGGHIDGWDVGEGAQDDAGGILICWEALRLLKSLGMRPRRTIRVVLWTNEENGLRGAKGYRAAHDEEVANHVLAIESDYGTFHPTGYTYGGNEMARSELQSVVNLLRSSVGPMEITKGGGGADIGPLMAQGVPGAGLMHKDERYFWYHHSDADTLEKIDKEDFRNCVATLAVTVFVVADMPQRLTFGKAEI